MLGTTSRYRTRAIIAGFSAFCHSTFYPNDGISDRSREDVALKLAEVTARMRQARCAVIWLNVVSI